VSLGVHADHGRRACAQLCPNSAIADQPSGTSTLMEEQLGKGAIRERDRAVTAVEGEGGPLARVQLLCIAQGEQIARVRVVLEERESRLVRWKDGQAAIGPGKSRCISDC
jgi:hypothetical protein